MASSDSLYTMPLSKVIQLKEDMSFPDDIVIFEESVSDKHRMTGFYDTTMDAFTCRIYKKEKDEKEQGIGLRIDAVRRLLTLFPRLEGIKQRYEKREMQTHYRYEIADGIFVTMGQNAGRYGSQHFIDIRQFIQDVREETPGPSKIGVRLGVDFLTTLKLDLKNYLGIVNRQIDRSTKILKSAQVVVSENAVFAARRLQIDCYGCKINHGSQREHMGVNGCMEEIEWCDMVELYYQSTTVPGDAATQLAEKTSTKLGEKTLFIDGVKHYSTLELKQTLKGLNDLERQDDVYQTAKAIVDEENQVEGEIGNVAINITIDTDETDEA